MIPNDRLLDDIRSRPVRNAEFSYGIRTADQYVRTLLECIGSDACYKFAATRRTSFNDVLDKASRTLVYSNSEMVVEDKQTSSFSLPGAPSGVEVPKNTLIVMRHVLSTPHRDRDGDILRSEGASLDPKMLMLWQHIPTLPIGKCLYTAQQDESGIKVVSAIVDIGDVAHDAAVMVDNDMLRYSHGFRALEFQEMKEDGMTGYDITKWEVMEESGVSIPSNITAETEEVFLSLVEGGKLTSGLVKECGKSIRERRPTSMAVQYREQFGDYSREIAAPNASTFSEVFDKTTKDKINGNGSSGKAEGKQDATPIAPTEEVKAAGEGQATVESGNAEGVKRAPLEGSWEWIERKLRNQVERFLELSGQVSMRDRFGWIAGTYPDHAIICAEHYESGIDDEFIYFKAPWEIIDGEPKFVIGEVQPVEIVTTVEIRERSPLFSDKQTTGEKVGRVLSQRNLGYLEDVKGGVEELGSGETLSRGGAALCRECVTKLSTVIDQASGGDGESSAEVTVHKAMGLVLAQASGDERAQMISVLQVMQDNDAAGQVASDYGALVGS